MACCHFEAGPSISKPPHAAPLKGSSRNRYHHWDFSHGVNIHTMNVHDGQEIHQTLSEVAMRTNQMAMSTGRSWGPAVDVRKRPCVPGSPLR